MPRPHWSAWTLLLDLWLKTPIAHTVDSKFWQRDGIFETDPEPPRGSGKVLNIYFDVIFFHNSINSLISMSQFITLFSKTDFSDQTSHLHKNIAVEESFLWQLSIAIFFPANFFFTKGGCFLNHSWFKSSKGSCAIATEFSCKKISWLARSRFPLDSSISL